MLHFASLWAAVLTISFVLTMVGLGGGLIFSPLFLMLGLSKAGAASTSLFLNLVAASSAAVTYGRKKMVDFFLSLPLILSSSLAAPFGSCVNGLIDVQLFSILMAVILFLAAALFSFAGGQVGARFMASQMQGRTISLIFSTVLIIFSLRLLYQALA